MSISWPPIASISSRTTCSALRCTRHPAGSHDHRPLPTWRMSPARTMSLCDVASASAGGSRSVGRKRSDILMSVRKLTARMQPPVSGLEEVGGCEPRSPTCAPPNRTRPCRTFPVGPPGAPRRDPATVPCRCRNFDSESLLSFAMPTMRKPRVVGLCPTLTGLAAAALISLLLAAPTAANRNQESIFQDDGVLQLSGADAQKSALNQMKALGADTVHVLVGWRRIAPSPDSRSKPAGFDASDPSAYPAGAFDTLDSLVKEARADDLDILFT